MLLHQPSIVSFGLAACEIACLIVTACGLKMQAVIAINPMTCPVLAMEVLEISHSTKGQLPDHVVIFASRSSCLFTWNYFPSCPSVKPVSYLMIPRLCLTRGAPTESYCLWNGIKSSPLAPALLRSTCVAIVHRIATRSSPESVYIMLSPGGFTI